MSDTAFPVSSPFPASVAIPRSREHSPAFSPVRARTPPPRPAPGLSSRRSAPGSRGGTGARRSAARTSTPSRETCAPPPTAAPPAKPGTGAPLPPDRPPTGTGTRARIALAPELDHPHAKLIQTSPPSPSRPLISLPLLLMLAAVALGWNLSGYRLFDPDEGRNAEVAREMAHSNDYVVPHLDGLPYLRPAGMHFSMSRPSALVAPPQTFSM